MAYWRDKEDPAWKQFLGRTRQQNPRCPKSIKETAPTRTQYWHFHSTQTREERGSRGNSLEPQLPELGVDRGGGRIRHWRYGVHTEACEGREHWRVRCTERNGAWEARRGACWDARPLRGTTEEQWMNVVSPSVTKPACAGARHALRLPGRVSSLPGWELPGPSYLTPVPGRHHLVRPGPKITEELVR